MPYPYTNGDPLFATDLNTDYNSRAPATILPAPLAAPFVARGIGFMLGDVFDLNDAPGLFRDGSHDDSSAWAFAVQHVTTYKRRMRIGSLRPGGGAWGPILLAGGTVPPKLDACSIIGDNVDDIYSAGQGTQFRITDATNPPFPLGRNVTLSGFNVFYPNQTEAYAAAHSGNPLVYPPTFTSHGSDPMGTLRMIDLRINNAYDLFVQDGLGTALGDVVIRNMRAFALRDYFRTRSMLEVCSISDSLFSWESYAAAGVNQETYNATHGCLFHMVGNGTPTVADSTNSSNGWFVSGSYLFGANKCWWCDGGLLTGGRWNIGCDQVPNILQCDPGGSVIDFCHEFGDVYQQVPLGITVAGGALNSHAYYINQPSPAGAKVTIGARVSTGWLNGGMLYATGANIGEIRVQCRLPFARSGTAVSAIQIHSATNARLFVEHAELDGSAVSGCIGVNVDSGHAVVVRNSDFRTLNTGILNNATSAHISGNTADNVPTPVGGTGAVTGGSNSW